MPALHYKQWSPVSLCSSIMKVTDAPFSDEEMQGALYVPGCCWRKDATHSERFVLNAVQAAAKFGASFYGHHSMGSIPR